MKKVLSLIALFLLVGSSYSCKWYIVKSESLSIRSGPGVSYPQVGELTQGEKVCADTITNSEWLKLEGENYIYKEYVGNTLISCGEPYCVPNLKEPEGIYSYDFPDDTPGEPGYVQNPAYSNVYVPSYLRELQIADLKKHNFYRIKHGAQPVQLSEELLKISQDYAENLASQGCKLVHTTNRYTPDGVYFGENLYMCSKMDDKGAATDDWYAEEPKYDYCNPGITSGSGHFTQVVWKNSKYVGFGYAQNVNSGCSVVVGQYIPGGNYGGQFPNNVQPENTCAPPVEEEECTLGEPICVPDIPEGKYSYTFLSDTPGESGYVPKYNVTIPDVATLRSLQIEELRKTNEFRRQHGAPPVELSEDALKFAQEKAEEMMNKNSIIVGFGGKLYETNVYSGYSSRGSLIGGDATKRWYIGAESHDYCKPGSNLWSGDYLNIIWGSTKYVGFGYAQKGFSYTIVAVYGPKHLGLEEKEVLPLNIC